MLTLEERRESFVEDALPYVAGTDYGDGKMVIARIGLGMGFDQGYQFAIEKASNYLRKEYQQMNIIIRSVCGRNVGDLINIESSIKSFCKAMEKE